MSVDDRLIKIAVVTSSHGVKGLVKIKLFTESDSDFTSFPCLYTKSSEEMKVVPHFVNSNGMLIASVNGISTKNEADAIKGMEIYVKRSDMPTLSENEYYHEDLISLKAQYEDGEIAGVIKSVVNFGASDLIEIETSSSTFYYPFHQNFIMDVSFENGIVVIKKLED